MLLLAQQAQSGDTYAIMREHIVLTGFMGVGKSTAGKLAAAELEIPFTDSDTWLEEHAEVDIAELVRSDMERFRQLEAEAFKQILRTESRVIATGGGIVTTEAGRAALLGSGVPVLWLRAPFTTSAERVSADPGNDRPLFEDLDTAASLHRDRQVWYAQTATHVVDATDTKQQVASAIVSIARHF